MGFLSTRKVDLEAQRTQELEFIQSKVEECQAAVQRASLPLRNKILHLLQSCQSSDDVERCLSEFHGILSALSVLVGGEKGKMRRSELRQGSRSAMASLQFEVLKELIPSRGESVIVNALKEIKTVRIRSLKRYLAHESKN
jgi:hypothetical protein